MSEPVGGRASLIRRFLTPIQGGEEILLTEPLPSFVARRSAPPSFSAAASIASRAIDVVLFGVPFLRPPVFILGLARHLYLALL
jgi:hypothetical protein